ETLPWIAVAWHGPAYTDSGEETAALDAVSRLGFDQTSPLHQKLVIDEQKADVLNAGPPNNLDPELFGVTVRVKNAADLPSIQQLDPLSGCAFFFPPPEPPFAEPGVLGSPGNPPLPPRLFVFPPAGPADPADKPVLAHLTSGMLGDGGTKDLTYKQIVDAMY